MFVFEGLTIRHGKGEVIRFYLLLAFQSDIPMLPISSVSSDRRIFLQHITFTLWSPSKDMRTIQIKNLEYPRIPAKFCEISHACRAITQLITLTVPFLAGRNKKSKDVGWVCSTLRNFPQGASATLFGTPGSWGGLYPVVTWNSIIFVYDLSIPYWWGGMFFL